MFTVLIGLLSMSQRSPGRDHVQQFEQQGPRCGGFAQFQQQIARVGKVVAFERESLNIGNVDVQSWRRLLLRGYPATSSPPRASGGALRSLSRNSPNACCNSRRQACPDAFP